MYESYVCYSASVSSVESEKWDEAEASGGLLDQFRYDQ